MYNYTWHEREVQFRKLREQHIIQIGSYMQQILVKVSFAQMIDGRVFTQFRNEKTSFVEDSIRNIGIVLSIRSGKNSPFLYTKYFKKLFQGILNL